jgi:hypothetical protein
MFYIFLKACQGIELFEKVDFVAPIIIKILMGGFKFCTNLGGVFGAQHYPRQRRSIGLEPYEIPSTMQSYYAKRR